MSGSGNKGMTTVGDLAALVAGEVLGDPNVEITQVAQASDVGPGEVAYAVSERFLDIVRKTPASAVFVKEPAEDLPIPQIVVPDPRAAFGIGPQNRTKFDIWSAGHDLTDPDDDVTNWD